MHKSLVFACALIVGGLLLGSCSDDWLDLSGCWGGEIEGTYEGTVTQTGDCPEGNGTNPASAAVDQDLLDVTIVLSRAGDDDVTIRADRGFIGSCLTVELPMSYETSGGDMVVFTSLDIVFTETAVSIAGGGTVDDGEGPCAFALAGNLTKQ